MIQNSVYKIVFLFIFLTTNLVAQNKPDDLKAIWENPKNADSTRFNALNEFYDKTTLTFPDSVIQITNFHTELAKKKNNKNEMVKALSEKSLAFFIKDDLNKAEECTNEAIKIQTALKNKVMLARLYSNLASIYRTQSKFIETIKYYNYSLKILRDSREEKNEADVLGNLGLVYLDLKNNEIAIDCFEKALKIYKKLKLQDKVGYISLNIGGIDFEKGNYKKSIENTKKALKIFEENNNEFPSIDCNYLLAKLYQKTNKIKESFAFINKSIDLSLKLGNKSRIIQSKTFLAELYLETDIIKATQIGEETLTLLDSNIDKKTNANLYSLLYKCYKKSNQIELSHEMYEKYIVYNDSVVKEQSNLELMKEAVNQEYKIALSKTKQSFQKSEKKLKRDQLIKLVLVILISLLLVFSIYFFARKKSIANRKEREALVEKIENLKKSSLPNSNETTEIFELNRINVEKNINRKLNETDWKVLNVLLENPVSSNKKIASQIFMSVDGIGSSLRRMYDYFEISESKYKKTDLIRKAIQFSNNS